MRHEREQAVWKRATELWENAGRQGVPEDFWEAAVKEVDEEFADEPATADAEPLRPLIP